MGSSHRAQSSTATLLHQRHRKRNEVHSQIVGELTELRAKVKKVPSSASDPAEMTLQVPGSSDSSFFMVRDSSSMNEAELADLKIDEED